MSSGKGFTILEVLVAMAIFSILAAAAMSFYQYQSRKGAGAARHKMAQEAVTLALMQIKRDIMQAGLGLRAHQNLALFVQDGGGTAPDTLYLSFSDHLEMDVTPDIPNSFFDESGKPGEKKAWFDITGTTLTVTSVNSSVDKFATAALITSGTGSVSDPHFMAIDPNVPSKFVVTTLNPQVGINKHDLKYDWTVSGLAPTGPMAPAIEYRLDLDTTTTSPVHEFPGTLLRNGVAILGAQSTLGGFSPDNLRPLMKVTDFQVRCQFRSGASYIWSPNTVAFTVPNRADLRLVEVTIRYIIRDEGGGYSYPARVRSGGVPIPGFNIPGDDCLPPYTDAKCRRSYGPWKIGGTQTIQVSPRNIVMWVYLSGS